MRRCQITAPVSRAWNFKKLSFHFGKPVLFSTFLLEIILDVRRLVRQSFGEAGWLFVKGVYVSMHKMHECVRLQPATTSPLVESKGTTVSLLPCIHLTKAVSKYFSTSWSTSLCDSARLGLDWMRCYSRKVNRGVTDLGICHLIVPKNVVPDSYSTIASWPFGVVFVPVYRLHVGYAG